MKKSFPILVAVLTVVMLLAATGNEALSAGVDPKAYFTKPVTFIVPYAAGSSVDINARILAPSLERAMGVTVVIENREGGGNAVGLAHLSQQRPDGYTIGVANIASMCIPNVMGASPIDPSRDLEFIGTNVTDPFLIFVRADSPYKTLTEIVEKVRTEPRSIRFGGTGATGTDAMMCYNIQSIADVEFNFVAFGADSEIIAAILGGHIDVYASSLSGSSAMIKSGSIRPIAVGGDERLAELPDVMTTKEQGFDLAFNRAMRGIFTPANLAPDAKAALAAALETAVADPDFIAKCGELGLTPAYLDSDVCDAEVANVMKFLNDNRETFR